MSLRILLDECLGGAFAARLASLGHDLLLIKVVAPSSDDEDVFDLAVRDQRLLVTADRGFGYRAILEQRPVPGVCVVRNKADATDADRLHALATQLPGSLVLLQKPLTRIRAVGFFRPDDAFP